MKHDSLIRKPLSDAGKIVPVPVDHQHRRLGGLYEILQSVQLAGVERDGCAVIRIDTSVCKLAQLVGEGCGIGSCDHRITLGTELHDQLIAKGAIHGTFLLREADGIAVGNKLGHREMVERFHADGNIPDLLIDLLLRTRT